MSTVDDTLLIESALTSLRAFLSGIIQSFVYKLQIYPEEAYENCTNSAVILRRCPQIQPYIDQQIQFVVNQIRAGYSKSDQFTELVVQPREKDGKPAGQTLRIDLRCRFTGLRPTRNEEHLDHPLYDPCFAEMKAQMQATMVALVNDERMSNDGNQYDSFTITSTNNQNTGNNAVKESVRAHLIAERIDRIK